jgi:hypothetical protein
LNRQEIPFDLRNVSHSHFSRKDTEMKTPLLLAALVSVAAIQVSAAPQVGNATLNPAAAQAHHIENLHKYGGPKANPGKVKVPQLGGAAAANLAFYDEYCGNGKKPIPGVGPIGGGGVGNAALMSDFERCGTRVPGRIPGNGPVGPR